MGLFSRLRRKRPESNERTVQWSLAPWEAKARAAIMTKLAAGYGIDLDYSPESLASVDFLIDKERETRVGMTDEMVQVIVSLGSYVGEVMVREMGGKWTKGSGDPNQDPLVMEIDGTFAINVVSVVFRRFLQGPPFSVAVMYGETEKLRQGKQEP